MDLDAFERKTLAKLRELQEFKERAEPLLDKLQQMLAESESAKARQADRR